MKYNFTEKSVNERLATNVSEAREAKGMSLSEVSRKAHLAFMTVHRVELGWRGSKHIPNLRTITRLAKVLDTTPHHLIR